MNPAVPNFTEESKSWFDSVSDNAFPLAQYYLNKHGFVANKLNNSDNVKDNKLKSKLLKQGFKIIWNRYKTEDCVLQEACYVVELDTTLISVHISDMGDDNLYIEAYYKDLTDLDYLIKYLKKNPTPEVSEGRVSLIIQRNDGLSTTSFQTKADANLDVELHYGAEFAHKYKVLVDKLNSDDISGISLLHGVMGTGKSSILKLLTKHVKAKEIIFVPPYLAEQICGPSFIPFLIQKKNCVLIIEDAEKVLLSRDSGEGSSGGVSNLLNISDGILGDCLNIHIICTFNVAKTSIDKALLRPGRLCVDHKFDALSKEDATKLLEYIFPGKGYESSKSMTLAECYSFEEERLISENERQLIGFRR